MAQKVITELQLRDDFGDTVNIPADDTIQTYRVTGAQIRNFLTPLGNNQYNLIKNAGISVSAAAGAMTLGLRQKDGSTALETGINSTEIAFRDQTLTSSAVNVIGFDTATTLVIPSGATLGFVNGDNARVFVYAYYDGTNKGLAVSSKRLDESLLHNIIEIDSNSDSNALYATAARTDAAIRLLYFFQINAITTAGTWTAPTLVSTVVESGMSKGLLRTVIFTSSGTYNKNPNADFVEVTVVGGGGGGGGADGAGASSASAGAGGGGGGTAIKTIAASSLGDTETITVGAGGTAGASTAGTGGDGGTSSFGSHCLATGGDGGGGDTGTGAVSFGSTPPNGGIGSSGDININGSAGDAGFRSQPAAGGGRGGDSTFGSGGRGIRASSSTSTGQAPIGGYGGGGGGAATGNTSGNAAGAAGRSGIVIVKEYKY